MFGLVINTPSVGAGDFFAFKAIDAPYLVTNFAPFPFGTDASNDFWNVYLDFAWTPVPRTKFAFDRRRCFPPGLPGHTVVLTA